jgi:hypothetical protein
MTRTRDIWVDFNQMEETGSDIFKAVVESLVEHADRQLYLGEDIIVGDDDGNTCNGQVLHVGHKWYLIGLNLDSWEEEN